MSQLLIFIALSFCGGLVNNPRLLQVKAALQPFFADQARRFYCSLQAIDLGAISFVPDIFLGVRCRASRQRCARP